MTFLETEKGSITFCQLKYRKEKEKQKITRLLKEWMAGFLRTSHLNSHKVFQKIAWHFINYANTFSEGSHELYYTKRFCTK